jgi:hypothetical protein
MGCEPSKGETPQTGGFSHLHVPGTFCSEHLGPIDVQEARRPHNNEAGLETLSRPSQRQWRNGATVRQR